MLLLLVALRFCVLCALKRYDSRIWEHESMRVWGKETMVVWSYDTVRFCRYHAMILWDMILWQSETMSENDTDYMWPCFAFLFAFDQHLYFPIVLLLFRHLFFKSLSLFFYSICCLKLYLLIVPLLLFPYFLLHSFQAFLVPTYFFSRLCQGTTGPEGQSTTRPQDQRTRGRVPEDHRTRGPQDQRTTGPEEPKFLFLGL